MNRRDSRINAFCLLFETDFHPECGYDEIYERAQSVRGEKFSAFTRELYAAATSHLAEIDAEIKESSKNWSVSRMSAASRAAVRMAAAEMMYSDVPPKAAINEALEISKIYDDEKATSFINGILNNIARRLGKIGDGEK